MLSRQNLIVSIDIGNFAGKMSNEDNLVMDETTYLTNIPGLVDKIKSGEQENIDEMQAFNPDEDW